MSERLDQVKKTFGEKFIHSDIKWLIKQAEQKERFKKLHQNYVTRYTNVVSENNELNEENTRLREALKFYADEDNYNLTAEADKIALCEYIHIVDLDNGDKARQALEVKS